MFQEMWPLYLQEIWPTSGWFEPRPAHQLSVFVDFGRRLPAGHSMDPRLVVLPSPLVELSAEVTEGTEVDPPHQLLGEDAVGAFELPSLSRVVRATIDHGNPSLSTVAPKLLRYEETPVVDVERPRLATAIGNPPEAFGGFLSSLSSVRAGHREVPKTVVQDGVDIDMPSNPRDSELVDVHLPKGVDVTPLEPPDRLRLPDDAYHEPMALEDAMGGARASPYPSPPKEGIDPKGAPGRMLPTKSEDPIDEVAVRSIGAAVGPPRLVPQRTDTFLSVVSEPTTQGPLGYSEDPANFRRANSPLQVLLERLQSMTHILSSQLHPSPRAAICPGNSGGQMSGYTTGSGIGGELHVAGPGVADGHDEPPEGAALPVHVDSPDLGPTDLGLETRRGLEAVDRGEFLGRTEEADEAPHHGKGPGVTPVLDLLVETLGGELGALRQVTLVVVAIELDGGVFRPSGVYRAEVFAGVERYLRTVSREIPFRLASVLIERPSVFRLKTDPQSSLQRTTRISLAGAGGSAGWPKFRDCYWPKIHERLQPGRLSVAGLGQPLGRDQISPTASATRRIGCKPRARRPALET